MEKYINKLSIILNENKVCPSHGIEHAINVLNNAKKAIEVSTFHLSKEEEEAILLAALLHDADDHKFFPEHIKNENVKNILEDKKEDFIELVINLINLVSSSKNGDSIPEEIIGKEWQLIPRYADRLEAIGKVGIERCFTYTKNSNGFYYLQNTPKAKTEEEIWKIATKERYQQYKGSSQSMIDHFYDKLLRLTDFPIPNKYFEEECALRRKPLIDFILKFGNNEICFEEDIEIFLKNS